LQVTVTILWKSNEGCQTSWLGLPQLPTLAAAPTPRKFYEKLLSAAGLLRYQQSTQQALMMMAECKPQQVQWESVSVSFSAKRNIIFYFLFLTRFSSEGLEH
jgi:hypothetical protein